MSTVLIVEDETSLREGLTSVVSGMGHAPLPAAGVAEARAHVAASTVDAVLLDIRLRDGDGLEFLRELRGGAQHDAPVIMVTAYGDSDRTIHAMRDGAFEYLTKPFDLATLRATLERALKQRDLARTVPRPQAPTAQKGLVGASAAMLEVWKLIGRAAASQAPVLITGETGTGKELVARAIHEYSARAAEPFLAVNLAALPGTLLESELFGHEKGSFTGAAARRAGRIESAGKGTLFLDEIGDLDAALQTKLLRVLQEGTYERVGGGETLHNEARIVTATNKRVRPGEQGSTFRDDLYYRLAVIEIEVPPLRDRKSDIPLLVAHALPGTPARAMSEEAMRCLSDYHWPGNVRELLHMITRAAALCGGEVIDDVNLPDLLCAAPPATAEADEAKAPAAARVVSATGIPHLRDAIAEVETRWIKQALAETRGNRSEAAKLLGISRAALYNRIEEYGIAG